MAATIRISLTGTITPDGRLEVELPPDLPAGEAKVTLEVEQAQPLISESAAQPPEQGFTDDEIEELLKPGVTQPMTPEAWKAFFQDYDPGEWANITDSVAWVQEIRRKRHEHLWGRSDDDR
jgi:hypothetical protein